MDNLDIDVKNAKALGLSYGQYKALHYDPHAPVVKKDKKKPLIICPICGKGVNPPRKKFCSDECRKVSDQEYKRKWAYKRYHELQEKGGEQDADS